MAAVQPRSCLDEPREVPFLEGDPAAGRGPESPAQLLSQQQSPRCGCSSQHLPFAHSPMLIQHQTLLPAPWAASFPKHCICASLLFVGGDFPSLLCFHPFHFKDANPYYPTTCLPGETRWQGLIPGWKQDGERASHKEMNHVDSSSPASLLSTPC